MRAVQILLVPMLVGLAGVDQAAAVAVAVNKPSFQVTSIGNLVMGAKYRVSPTNFDLSLDSGGGTQGFNTISTNVGNLAALHNVTFGFSLRNIAGQGIVFSLTSPSNVVRSAAWGSFSPALTPTPTVAAAQLQAAAATGQTVGTLLSPGQLPMNALHLEVSSRIRPNPNATYNPVVSLSDVAFVATGVSTYGHTIASQTVTSTTNLVNANFNEVGPGFASQWLVTNGDFWDFDWTLSGKVNAQINNITFFNGATNIGNIDEFVKFGVSGKQVSFTGAIPEPASWAMLIVGFGLVGAAMRRHRGGPWRAFA